MSKLVIAILLMFSVSGFASEKMPSISIKKSDKACVQDSDCGITPTQCSCSCGDAVNVKHIQKYFSRLEQLCENYQGKMCKVDCSGQPKCIKKVCAYVAE